MSQPIWKRYVDKAAVGDVIREKLDGSRKPLKPHFAVTDLRAAHLDNVSKTIQEHENITELSA